MPTGNSLKYDCPQSTELRKFQTPLKLSHLDGSRVLQGSKKVGKKQVGHEFTERIFIFEEKFVS